MELYRDRAPIIETEFKGWEKRRVQRIVSSRGDYEIEL